VPPFAGRLPFPFDGLRLFMGGLVAGPVGRASVGVFVPVDAIVGDDDEDEEGDEEAVSFGITITIHDTHREMLR
jgi:hypothetical protein